MFSAAISFICSLTLAHSSTNKFATPTQLPPRKFTSSSSFTPVWYKFHYRSPERFSMLTGFKLFSPVVMEWQDCTVKMEIDVPVSVAYNCYLDRESVPPWMPFISSVKVLEDKPHLSRWLLKYKAFGQDIEYSWLARNMQPIPNQKIHWRSTEGLPNRGAVRFFPKGPASCTVEVTVSFEVPHLLIPVASTIKPFLEDLLKGGLERFATHAKSASADGTLVSNRPTKT